LFRTNQYLLIAAFVFVTAPAAWPNIVINPTYDSSITSDANVTAIENTIQSAISAYESDILTNITVGIYFQEGGGLGQSTYFVNAPTYTQFYNGLISHSNNTAAINALKANGGNASTNGGVNPVTGGTYIEMKSANERAVGINQAAQCYVSGGVCVSSGSGSAYDGIITLNTAITSPGGGTYSLLATAEHEIDEVLGLGSALENVSASSGTETFANDTPFSSYSISVSSPEDLYRWTAPTGGTRATSVDCAAPGNAYFAYGASTGLIDQFNNQCNGADFGDWANSGTHQVQDAYGTPGATPTLSTGELSALSAIGYDVVVPEPATWAMMIGSLAGLAILKRKRS
jgi:hypothetical protein